MKIALAMACTKESCQNVVSDILSYNPQLELALLIYYNKKDRSLIARRSNVREIIFVNSVSDLIRHLHAKKQLQSLIENFFSYQTTYCLSRNLLLFLALAMKNDILIYFDDDEYPLLMQNTAEVNYFEKHINYLTSGLDIVCGYRYGYITPIPVNINTLVNLDILSELEDVLLDCIEVAFPHFLTKSENNFLKYNDNMKDSILFSTPKWIYGGNLGMNLTQIKKIPPFYQPPYARGEDTIFSLQIDHLHVAKVRSAIFHDPHQVITSSQEIDLKNYQPPQDSPKYSLEKFKETILGWLGYTPLKIRLQYPDDWQSRLDLIMRKLLLLSKKDKSYFEHFKFYLDRLELDYNLVKEKRSLFYQIVDIIQQTILPIPDQE